MIMKRSLSLRGIGGSAVVSRGRGIVQEEREMEEPNRESSGHYRSQRGKEYFAWQSQGGLQRGRINARKFARFIRPHEAVLDFGCGGGTLLHHLDCARRIGVEVNPAAREAAQANGIEVHESLETVPDGSIDAVVSNHSLEHVLSPVHVLSDLRRKLMPGGRLVLCVPIDDWRTQKRINLSDVNHHLYTWTPLLMGNLLTEAGYRVERVWVYTHAWPPKNWQKLDAALPAWLFDLICTATAWRYRRRQIMAVASSP